jgi:hypothetical protein
MTDGRRQMTEGGGRKSECGIEISRIRQQPHGVYAVTLQKKIKPSDGSAGIDDKLKTA